jgi:hypothetical protein
MGIKEATVKARKVKAMGTGASEICAAKIEYNHDENSV